MSIEMKMQNSRDVITAHIKKMCPADQISSYKDCAVWVVDVKLYVTQEQYEMLSKKGTQLSLKVL